LLAYCGAKPYKKKKRSHAKIIATRFAKKSKNVPTATSRLRKYSHIPVAHRGGNKEAAIAAPTIVPDNFLYHSTKKAIIPDANATHKSSIVGVVLARISLVKVPNGTKVANIIAPIRENAILNTRYFSDLKYNFILPVAIAKLIAWMGCNNGAINIAPIITGVESVNNPNVAIITEERSCSRYKISISTHS